MAWAFLVNDLKSFRVFLSFLLSFFPSEGRKSVDRRRNITKLGAFIALQPRADRPRYLNYFKLLFAIISINIFEIPSTLVSINFIKKFIHVSNYFYFPI